MGLVKPSTTAKLTATLAATLFVSSQSVHATSCFGPTAERANSTAIEVTKDGVAIPSVGVFLADFHSVAASFPAMLNQADLNFIMANRPNGQESVSFVRDEERPVQPTPGVARHLAHFKELRTPDCGDCGDLPYFTIPPGVYVPSTQWPADGPDQAQNVTLTIQADRTQSELRYAKGGAQFSVKYSLYWARLPEYEDSCGCAVTSDQSPPGIAWLGAFMVLLGLRRSSKRV